MSADNFLDEEEEMYRGGGVLKSSEKSKRRPALTLNDPLEIGDFLIHVNKIQMLLGSRKLKRPTARAMLTWIFL